MGQKPTHQFNAGVASNQAFIASFASFQSEVWLPAVKSVDILDTQNTYRHGLDIIKHVLCLAVIAIAVALIKDYNK